VTQPRHFNSSTRARQSSGPYSTPPLPGLVTTAVRDSERFVIVPAEQLRAELTRLLPSRAEVLAEGGGWAVIIPGLPVHGDGESFDSALDDAIQALREYAEDWNERLRLAPNHARHRAVVELVELSPDAQVRDWLLGGAITASANAGVQDGPGRLQTA
jgi:predicted RNase H-like HicB family nuclease